MTASTLMLLFRQVEVTILALIWSCHLPVSSASIQFKSHQITFYSFFPKFPGRSFFPFPSRSSSTNSRIFISFSQRKTCSYQRLGTKKSSIITATNLTLHITLIIRCSTLRCLNSSATVRQVLLQYKRVCLTQDWYILPRCFKDKPILHLSPWTFSRHYLFFYWVFQMFRLNN